MKLVTEIIAWGKGEMVYTRKELREAHVALRNHTASPAFITKNLAAKVPKSMADFYPAGSYNLEPFVKYAKEHPPTDEVKRKPAKKAAKVTAKKTGVKKESKGKRTTAKKEAPVPVTETTIDPEVMAGGADADQDQDAEMAEMTNTLGDTGEEEMA